MTTLTTTGFSHTAKCITRRVDENRQSLNKIFAFGIENTMQELATVWIECSKSNWDGYDAKPVTWDAFSNTYIFLQMLPLGYQLPSINAEPDGDFTLEWHRSARRTLSVSVTPEGELHYAALLGPNRTCGTEAFFGEVPDPILELIKRVYTT